MVLLGISETFTKIQMPKEAYPRSTELLDILYNDLEQEQLFHHYHQILLIAERERGLCAEEAFTRYFHDQPGLARIRPKVYDLMFLSR